MKNPSDSNKAKEILTKFLVYDHKGLLEFKETFYDSIKYISNNSKRITKIRAEIRFLKKLKTELKLQREKKMSPVDRVNSIDVTGEVMYDAIQFCQELLENYTEDEKPNKKIVEIKNVKLNWNGQKNSLIYLFYQLKREYHNGNPIINNSNDEIANFLKQNFDCFKNTKLSTINGVLKKSAIPPKSKKTIELKF